MTAKIRFLNWIGRFFNIYFQEVNEKDICFYCLREMPICYEKPSQSQPIKKNNDPMTKALIAAILHRSQGICERCHKMRGHDIHHIIPRREGGPNVLSNLIHICASCHERINSVERAAPSNKKMALAEEMAKLEIIMLRSGNLPKNTLRKNR